METIKQAIERKIASLRAGAGIRDLSDYVEIHRCKEGYSTRVLEVCFESADSQHYIRLRMISFSRSGKAGKSGKSLACTIREDKYGRHVFLRYRVLGKSSMFLSIPYPSWEALHAFVTA